MGMAATETNTCDVFTWFMFGSALALITALVLGLHMNCQLGSESGTADYSVWLPRGFLIAGGTLGIFALGAIHFKDELHHPPYYGGHGRRRLISQDAGLKVPSMEFHHAVVVSIAFLAMLFYFMIPKEPTGIVSCHGKQYVCKKLPTFPKITQ